MKRGSVCEILAASANFETLLSRSLIDAVAIDERGGDRLGGRERRAEAELLFDGGDLVANRWHQVTMLTSAPSCEADLANLTWCALVRRASPPRRPQASSPGLVVFLASEPRSARRIFLTLRFLNAG